MARLFFLIGALLAALSVAMGAYGAHTNAFDEVQSLWVEKAAHYQMIHAFALIITALVINNKRLFKWQAVSAGWCFLGGIISFSGSLYAMTFFTIDAGYITPLGGILFIFGWLLLAMAGPGVVKSRR
ncbi:MAG: DUF423 domain-containing protein [Desulfobacterales bacterium]|nr:DUF423 domain-containing protein [Deltaproteobacteria bacterium]NNK95573.1 DUF423 domain-containing protein [Desulfobacterales bacterium]